MLFIKKILLSSFLGLPLLVQSKFARAAAIISSVDAICTHGFSSFVSQLFCFSSIFISLHPHNYFQTLILERKRELDLTGENPLNQPPKNHFPSPLLTNQTPPANTIYYQHLHEVALHWRGSLSFKKKKKQFPPFPQKLLGVTLWIS